MPPILATVVAHGDAIFPRPKKLAARCRDRQAGFDLVVTATRQ